MQLFRMLGDPVTTILNLEIQTSTIGRASTKSIRPDTKTTLQSDHKKAVLAKWFRRARLLRLKYNF